MSCAVFLKCNACINNNHSSVVSAASTLWNGRPTVRIPIGVIEFFLLRNSRTGRGTHLAYRSLGTGVKVATA